MTRWGRFLGQLVLVLAMMAAGFVGAKLGLLGTRSAGASHNFGDVPTGAFYHAFVDYLSRSGVTAGCAAGQYCPEQPVTRGQMAVFLGLQRLVAGCPPDSVRVGSVCIDKHEASVWEVPAANGPLIQKIQLGTVTLAELQAGGFQRGVNSDDYGAGCPDTGNGCVNHYAVSIAGVAPSRFLTWFQATAAARNAGKRLPTNAEWQAAALGTPDPGAAPGSESCNTVGAAPVQTGSRASCESDVGAFDMVGNLSEWVGDWVPPLSGSCGAELFAGTGDANCLAGTLHTGVGGTAALFRGGSFNASFLGGVFGIQSFFPSFIADSLGFRAAR